MDLKRINDEPQEEKGNNKGNGKEKQETKIINQKPVEDSDIDEDEIIYVNLYDQLNQC